MIVHLRSALLAFCVCSQCLVAHGAPGGGPPPGAGASQAGQQQNPSATPQSPGQNSQGQSSLGGTILTYEFLKDTGTEIGSRLLTFDKTAAPALGHIKKLYITTTPPNGLNNQGVYFLIRGVYIALINSYYNVASLKTNLPTPATLKPDFAVPTETLGDITTAISTALSLLRTTTTLTETSGATDPLGAIPALSTCLSSHIPPIQCIYVDLNIDGQGFDDPNSLMSLMINAAHCRSAAAPPSPTVFRPQMLPGSPL